MRLAKAEAALTKLATVKRLRPNVQKIASQAGRALQALKAHKYFSYEVDAAGLLRWARKEEVIAAERAHDGWYLLHTNLLTSEAPPAAVQAHYKNLLEVEDAFVSSRVICACARSSTGARIASSIMCAFVLSPIGSAPI